LCTPATAGAALDERQASLYVCRMPANLSPEYRAAEAAFRATREPRERLECLREMLRTIPKHKGTEHLQADIKARIKDLSEQLESGRRGGGHGGPALVIRPEGAAQLGLVGPPNAGKSALHDRLTASGAAVAPYPFTTQFPQPGMLPFEDISFQLIDLPPLAAARPVPWLGSTLQTADAVLLVVDLAEPAVVEQLREALALLGQRRVTLTARWPADDEAGAAATRGAEAGAPAACPREGRPAGAEGRPRAGSGGDENRLCAGGGLHECGLPAGAGPAERPPPSGAGRDKTRLPSAGRDESAEDDPFRLRLPALVLANQADRVGDPAAELRALLELAALPFPALAVSAVTGYGLGGLAPWLFAHLGVVRVYTKVPGHPPDRQRPLHAAPWPDGRRRGAARPPRPGP
jgi:ribosome-interacting GTPase 1